MGTGYRNEMALTYALSIRTDDAVTDEYVASGAGTPAVIAAVLRAVANDLDPPKTPTRGRGVRD